MPIPVETLMKHLELDTKTSINEAYISGPLDLSNTRTKILSDEEWHNNGPVAL